MGSKIRKTIFTGTAAIASFIIVLALINLSLTQGSLNILPMLQKYIHTLASGSLGKSAYGRDVGIEVLTRLPRTLVLVILSLTAGSTAGVLIGMMFSYGGKKRGMTQLLVNTIPVSLPDILVIILLQAAMIKLHDAGIPHLPVTGYGHFGNIVLPVLCLSIIPAFYMARITYAYSADAYGEKFVLTSRAKGCPESRVHWVHVWRRIRPQVTESAYGLIPLLISNLLIVEKMFIYPGLSYNLFQALKKGDIYLFMGLSFGLALVYSAAVLIVWIFRRLDISYRRANI